MDKMKIDGNNLRIDDIKKILQDNLTVELSDEARQRCENSRSQIDRWLQKDAPPVYGINTGLGNLKDVVMPPETHIEWNKTLPYPHAAGFNPLLAPEVTRTALLLRANVLARGYSAIRPELIDRMLSIFNAGLAPVIYGLGSTGLSDLPPLSQMTMVVAGLPEARVYRNGEILPAGQAFKEAGLPETFELACKEVLAQMNGSTMTQSIAVLAFIRFKSLWSNLKNRLPQTSPELVARHLAYEQTFDFALEILNLENNITCDNPSLFEVGNENYEAVMGCNCSNTQVGYVMDLLSSVLCEISQDIIDNLPTDDCLRKQARHLRSLLKNFGMQVSADSIPTKGGQEDHVEFSYTAARKFERGVNVLNTLANI